MPHPSPARNLALSILTEITESNAYANIALRQAFKKSTLDARDRAFVTELVNETVRNLILIDHIINRFSKTHTIKMKPFIRNLMRLSVCQLKFLTKIPPSATVNEAVNLAKVHGFGPLSGFVNGVLRSIVRNPTEFDPSDTALRFSYPLWLYQSLVKWLGEEHTRIFCENSHQPPVTTIFTNTMKISPLELASRLQEEGALCETGLLLPQCLAVKNTADITALPSFKEGLFFVMDEGAALAVQALDLKPSQHVIDLCAAPGGKSFAAACMMEDKGHIQAFDLHAHRVKLIQDSLKRLEFSCIQARENDATIIKIPPADTVLVDAPCSGFGIIRRRPDIKFNRKPEDIPALVQTQRELLRAAADSVNPGGTLVYCTCTVAREENIDNIRWFTRHFPFATVDPNLIVSNLPSIKEDNCLQLLPALRNDAFFIAKLVKSYA